MYILIAVLIAFFAGAGYLLYKKSTRNAGQGKGGRSSNDNSNTKQE